MKLTLFTRITLCLSLLSTSYLVQADAYQQPKLKVTIQQALASLAQQCQDFTLDTESDHAFELYDHHQSFTLSHQWQDGSALAFVSHSETGRGDYGQIMAFTVNASDFIPGTDLIGHNRTFAMRHKQFITEQHPSGIAWLPAPANRDTGYLFIASENEQKVRIHQFSQDGSAIELPALEQTGLAQITDVWLAQQGDYNWLILHNMNAATGLVYRALTTDLFQFGKANEGELDIGSFHLINQYQAPANTGCGKSLGQNAQLVKDSENRWYLVHTYTGENICGANSGQNIVKAYPAYFHQDGSFNISLNPTPIAQTVVGSSTLPDGTGADGAAGFRVSKDGRLVIYLGGQYAYLSWFDWKTRVRECRSAVN